MFTRINRLLKSAWDHKCRNVVIITNITILVCNSVNNILHCFSYRRKLTAAWKLPIFKLYLLKSLTCHFYIVTKKKKKPWHFMNVLQNFSNIKFVYPRTFNKNILFLNFIVCKWYFYKNCFSNWTSITKCTGKRKKKETFLQNCVCGHFRSVTRERERTNKTSSFISVHSGVGYVHM